MSRKKGFILIIVIGLLGIMAFLGISLSSVSSSQAKLSQSTVLKAKSKIIARSGYEKAIVQIYEKFPSLSQTAWIDAIGNGSQSLNGDIAVVSIDDPSGMININDGIRAGDLELGSSYEANRIDPVEPDQTFTTAMVSFLRYQWVRGSVYLSIFGSAGSEPYQPGDYLESGGFKGRLNFVSKSGPLIFVFDTVNPPSPFGIWSPVHTRPKENISGRINLRLRRLLNSYGDVHRYLDIVGVPDPAGSNFNVPFNFTDSATLDRVIQGAAWAEQGLGDVIISSRPSGGYSSVDDIKDLLDTWGQNHLSTSYLGTQSFSHMCAGDLTVSSGLDESVVRLKKEFSVYFNEVVGAAVHPVSTKSIHLRGLDQSPLDLSDIWAKHAVAPINMNAASWFVRSSVFGALVNTSYLVQSSKTYLPGIDMSSEDHRSSMPQIGVSGPVFEASRIKENGVAEMSQKNRFMSLRDSMFLAAAWENYVSDVNTIDNFFDFEQFLIWHRVSDPDYVPYERAIPMGTYDDDPLNGGYFEEDYVEKSLPHFLSGIRRMPGYLGAPQSLLSPYVQTNAQHANGSGGYYYRTQKFAPGTQRRAEDFVQRAHLPVINFMPGGQYTISSAGYIVDEDSAVNAMTKIQVNLTAFQRSILRTQQQFETNTDSGNTDPLILLGPSFLTEGQNANNHIGFAGLKPKMTTVVGTPQINMMFEGDLNQAPGTNAPQDPAADPFYASITSAERAGLLTSQMEGAAQNIFGDGNASCDLSPFGGLLLGVNGHGPQHIGGAQSFTDSMYWRLQGPTVLPHQIMPLTKTAGEATGMGHVQLWVRIPSNYDIPHEIRSLWNPWLYPARKFVHVIWHLNQWQLFSGNDHNPFSIFLLYSFDPVTKKGSFKARLQYSNNLMDEYDAAAYPLKPFVVDPLIANQTDLMNFMVPPATTYPSWTAVGRRSMERTIELKDEPEAGPGTWHLVSVGWDLSRTQAAVNWVGPFDRKLWIKVNDQSSVDSNIVTQTNNPTTWMRLNNKFAGFYLGETHIVRRSDHHTYNNWGAFEDSNNSNVRDYFAPAWRLDSCVDDLQVQFGSLPTGHDENGAAGYSAPTERYDVTGEPEWVIDPGLIEGSKVLHFGARIYDPLDSKSGTAQGANHPSVSLSARAAPTGSDLIEKQKSIDGKSLFFGGTPVAAQSRFVLKYLNENPKGNSLINDNSDNWTEIPWIKEVSWHVMTPNQPMIHNWISE